MKKLLVISCVVCLIALSCKKKNPAPPKTNTTTSTTGTTSSGSTTGGTTTGSSGTPTNATSFNGMFLSDEYKQITGGAPFIFEHAQAFFSSVPVTDYPLSPGAGLPVSSVKINNFLFNNDGSGYYNIIDTSLDFSTEIWQVDGGNNGIPTFTINNMMTRPSGVSFTTFPATISKAAGFTLTLGLSGVKTGTFYLNNGTAGGSGITLPFDGSDQAIDLSAAQLNGLQALPASVIGMVIENSQVLNIQGKNFKFTKKVQIMSEVTINN